VHEAGRYAAMVMLARRYPTARLVFSGGSGELLHPDAPEDRTARQLLAQLGLDPARVTFEHESRNTWENMVDSKRLVQPLPGERWILVTAAMHMPRSVGVARAVGWPVIAWATDYETPDAVSILHGRVGDGLDIIDAAVKEWIGLAAYRATGRTASLFPAPEPIPPHDGSVTGDHAMIACDSSG
jgi:uncharacterized SAM-binding protein YcdF (DUF218 family)